MGTLSVSKIEENYLYTEEIERKTERKIKLFYSKARILQTSIVILHLLVDSTDNQ